mmetsp:Transcript_33930/g.52049  ORF Transcript_33930/g.52049 Transcript_33930/m.52049 type:complete len:212 (-) Transcript_33930:324-959(-)
MFGVLLAKPKISSKGFHTWEKSIFPMIASGFWKDQLSNGLDAAFCIFVNLVMATIFLTSSFLLLSTKIISPCLVSSTTVERTKDGLLFPADEGENTPFSNDSIPAVDGGSCFFCSCFALKSSTKSAIGAVGTISSLSLRRIAALILLFTKSWGHRALVAHENCLNIALLVCISVPARLIREPTSNGLLHFSMGLSLWSTRLKWKLNKISFR